MFSNNKNVGIGRITTIELQNTLSDIFKHKAQIKVSAYYNYNFDKWNIENIIQNTTADDSIDEINHHIELLKGLSKSNYVLENC